MAFDVMRNDCRECLLTNMACGRHDDPVCKGSIALGSGCGTCDRCKRELAQGVELGPPPVGRKGPLPKQTCKYCSKPLPMTMVQQGGMHLECYLIWSDLPIDAWKVAVDGTSYIETSAEALASMLEDMDFDTDYVITRVRMKQGEYHALPEFKGF